MKNEERDERMTMCRREEGKRIAGEEAPAADAYLWEKCGVEVYVFSRATPSGAYEAPGARHREGAIRVARTIF